LVQAKYRNKEVIYVNAGHNPPYLYKSKTNELIELNDGGILLGALPTMMPYQQGSFSMEKGDMIVSFTDGVTEAFDENREEYGEERLKKLILDNYSKKASVLTDKIVQHVMKFANGIQYDDITILVLKAI
jgi:Serine phosphatase RsbU, regulator of sigma subunit